MPELIMPKVAQALTIAGSDSGGGAGIQADLTTFHAQQVFGTSVITAITAQNTLGVQSVHLLPVEVIEAQLKAVMADFNITAYKLGMLGSVEIIECLAANLAPLKSAKLVLDPIMLAKNGTELLQKQGIDCLKKHLIPFCDVMTPNIPEACALTGIEIVDQSSLQKAAERLLLLGAKNVLIKGGHWQNEKSAVCSDWLFTQYDEVLTFTQPRFITPHTHGTGCTFSACLTAELAKGQELKSAVSLAKDFITAAITHPLQIGQGKGPTNHWAYSQKERK